MDRLEAMSVLMSILETGSFSAATRKLGVPLSTISRKIADLESHLNARLLHRSTRKLTLTEAGVAYVESCKRILDLVDEAERLAAGEYTTPRGDLIITAPTVFGRMHLVPLVSEFLAAYPEVNVHLKLTDQVLSLVDEHIDLALRIGRLPDSSLVATPLGTVCRVVCGSPAYFAGHGAPIELTDLADHRCISFDGIASGAAWNFTSHGRKQEQPITVRPRLVVNTAESAIDASIAGVGLTHVLSYHAWPAVEAGKLMLVLRDFEPEPVPVSLVHVGRELLPLKSRRFLEFAVPRLRHYMDRLTRKKPYVGGTTVSIRMLEGA